MPCGSPWLLGFRDICAAERTLPPASRSGADTEKSRNVEAEHAAIVHAVLKAAMPTPRWRRCRSIS